MKTNSRLSICITVLCGALYGLVANATSSVKRDKTVLVLIHSKTGNTLHAARAISEGIKRSGVQVELKHVPVLDLKTKQSDIEIAKIDELSKYAGIVIGSPVYFASPSAEILSFLQQGVSLWKNQSLKNIPVAVFLTAKSGKGVSSARESLHALLQSFGARIVNFNKISEMARVQDKKSFIEGGELFARSMEGQVHRSVGHPIQLPKAPAPVGNYRPYRKAGKLIYINQIALKEGRVLSPGIIGKTVSEDQARIATRQAMLNVLAVLKDAVDGDLSLVKQAVQLSGNYATVPEFTKHSSLLNAASDLTIKFLGSAKGVHTRSVFGSSSLPMGSPVELSAIFELH